MSMHNGTDGPAARAVCRCGLSNGERRNGSSPASHTVPPAHTAPLLPASADVTAAATASATAAPAVAAEPAAPRMTLSARRFRMEAGDTVIEIEWDTGHAGAAAPRRELAPAAEAVPQASAGASAARAAAQEPQDAARYVRAPLVGTFYHAPEVGARPFVGVGDVVQPGQTVGIIEVMKMMNPVTADVAGRVVEMIVGDARPVEYDQPLIALEPLGSG